MKKPAPETEQGASSLLYHGESRRPLTLKRRRTTPVAAATRLSGDFPDRKELKRTA